MIVVFYFFAGLLAFIFLSSILSGVFAIITSALAVILSIFVSLFTLLAAAIFTIISNIFSLLTKPIETKEELRLKLAIIAVIFIFLVSWIF